MKTNSVPQPALQKSALAMNMKIRNDSSAFFLVAKKPFRLRKSLHIDGFLQSYKSERLQKRFMEKICCAILAGGKAERLPDKPFLTLYGKPMVSYVIDSAAEYFDEVLVIAKKYEKEKIKELIQNKKQTKIISEQSGDFSPWNGIRTAAENSKAEWVLLLACDMPFIRSELFDLLVSKINPRIDCIIPRTDRLQPLCALYRRDVLEGCWMHRNPQEVSIFEGSVTRFAESLKKDVAQIPKEKYFWLFNINTKMDFEKAEGIVKNNTTDRYLNT